LLLTDPNPTPLDIKFRLLGTRVRIHPAYWLACVFLGWSYLQDHPISDSGVPELLLWALAMTLSILLHEFGHVFAGWAFGGRGEILLHSMGGLAIHREEFAKWEHILIALAGPAIQLALWLALFLTFGKPHREPWEPQTPGGLFLEQMLVINLFWPIFNLLPIWPLDGGQVVRYSFLYASRSYGVQASLWLSLVLCAAVVLNALAPRFELPHLKIPYIRDDSYLALLFFALFAVTAWLELEEIRRRRRSVFGDDW
jgi:Zn-dependent protease